MTKKAFLFSVDAIIATIILVSTILIFSNLLIEEKQVTHLEFLSSDMLNIMSELKIHEVNNSYVKTLISQGNISNVNNSLIDQIGELWALNKTGLAQNLAKNLTSELFPSQYGFSIAANNEELYKRGSGNNQVIVASRKMISGFERDKPIKGSTSRSFLKSIQEKEFSSYAYLGGFVGQGDISVFIRDIPSGVTLKEMMLEVDAVSNFNLLINNVQCNANFTPSVQQMQADRWNISGCLGLLTPGSDNEFTIQFPGDVSGAYIGGGFIKVSYTTTEFSQTTASSKDTVWLPGISGIINLYSSMYIPGTLNSMSVYLHFLTQDINGSNNTFYLTIGNYTLVQLNASGDTTIVLTDQNITPYLDYSNMSLKTVPIRIGFENATFGFIFEGNADVALITDLSGSMNWRMDSSSTGTLRECTDAQYSDPSTRRISIAKCLDKQFARDILNISGNQIGLISFNGATVGSQTVLPTTNINTIDSTVGDSVPLTGYSAGGSTCICCGINSAKDILTQGSTTSTLIASGSTWLYNDTSLSGEPLPDSSNNTWYSLGYSDDAGWQTGTAILGATNGLSYSPAVVTELNVDLSGSGLFADLWEHESDTAGAPNDFSSGILNSTANTYGSAGADDGWDWDTEDGTGPFGFDDDYDYNGIVSQRLEMDNAQNDNRCSSDDCSGAYGILINITDELYQTISSQGSATLSFWYEWDDRDGNWFESADQVWTKARWTSPNSGAHYLGSSLDSGHSGSDSDPEVATSDNPDVDYSGNFLQDITSWVESPGLYYLEIGGKLRASQNQEYGHWRFDDIQLEVSNATDHYYFRKNFTITDLSAVQRGIMNVLTDDRSRIYLNGQEIHSDSSSELAEYWNTRGINIQGNLFRQGENVIAVEIFNSAQAAKFDLELIGTNESREKAMMVMTDGVATTDAGCPQSGTPSEEAIQAACEAREDYGITVYAVGFSDDADEATLNSIAQCGEGIYTKSNNITALQEFYQDVASSIVSTSRHAQTIEVQGNLTESILFNDSYIKINYTPIVDPPEFGEIEVLTEVSNFQNCSFNVTIPAGMRIHDARLTSYSSEHWTDYLTVNNNEVYNLSTYNEDYTTLGDPFVIDIPPTYLQNGVNDFFIRTGDAPSNSTGCSLNNTFIYTGLVKGSISYSGVYEKADGCSWTIETDQGSTITADVPSTYSGAKSCSYTATNISFDPSDSIDQAVHELLANLDFDGNGKINIDIEQEDLEIEALWVSQVPYLWGPAILEVRLWQ